MPCLSLFVYLSACNFLYLSIFLSCPCLFSVIISTCLLSICSDLQWLFHLGHSNNFVIDWLIDLFARMFVLAMLAEIKQLCSSVLCYFRLRVLRWLVMLTVVTDATEKMEPPVFVVKPVNKDVKEEGKATFECKLKGKPLPEVTWSVVSYDL